MKRINSSKSRKIQETRGASFEDVVTEGVLLDTRDNPNYSDQYLEIYHFQDYVWVVIVGSNPERYITMFKSRKLKKEFGL